MSDKNKFWDDDDFTGEIDQSVFREPLEGENYADDDFERFFDEDIIDSELNNDDLLFDVSDSSFGTDDDYTVFFGGDNKDKPLYSDDVDVTRVAQKPSNDKYAVSDDERTRRLELKQAIRDDISRSRRSDQRRKKAESAKKSHEDENMSKGKRKKGSGFLRGLAYVLTVVCAACLIAAVAWILSTDVLGFTDENEEVVVTIPKDYSMSSVANILHEEGVVRFKGLFKVFAAISHAKDKISGGTYVLNKNYDYRAIISGMTKSGGKMVEVQVTIPEGYNMTQIFNLLEENSVCFASDLWEIAQYYNFEYDFLDEATLGEKLRLEGFLFPDTYKFYMNDTPTRVIDKMLDNFETRMKEQYLTRAKDMGYSLKDIITVASIIEKEAAGSKDRKDIASVIYNRLKNTSGPTVGFLQLDSTIHYIIYGTDTKFSTDIDSPYNTYLHKGLPAGPISNPGIAAIEAALYPNSTGYYYFAINKQRETQFFSSYNSFINFVNSSEYGG